MASLNFTEKTVCGTIVAILHYLWQLMPIRQGEIKIRQNKQKLIESKVSWPLKCKATWWEKHGSLYLKDQ